MVTTASVDQADRIKRLALHGLSADAWKRFSDEGFRHYELVEPGFKYNMTDLHAALGLHQLDRVEANLRRRREIWRRYDDAFFELPVFLPPPEQDGTRHARHLYTLLIDVERLARKRDDVLVAEHEQDRPLLDEPGDQLRLADQVLPEQLDGDLVAGGAVDGAPDGTGRAVPDGPDQDVGVADAPAAEILRRRVVGLGAGGGSRGGHLSSCPSSGERGWFAGHSYRRIPCGGKLF